MAIYVANGTDFLMHHGVKGMRWGVRKQRRIEKLEAKNTKARSDLHKVGVKPSTGKMLKSALAAGAISGGLTAAVGYGRLAAASSGSNRRKSLALGAGGLAAAYAGHKYLKKRDPGTIAAGIYNRNMKIRKLKGQQTVADREIRAARGIIGTGAGLYGTYKIGTATRNPYLTNAATAAALGSAAYTGYQLYKRKQLINAKKGRKK